jgi:DNA-binding LytR/AlgR family response regulator
VPPRHAPQLAVRKQGRIEFVAMGDLIYAQGADNYVELVLADGRRELFDRTLTQLAALLPGDFQRIHKSYLVRLSAVRKLHVGEGGCYRAELANGTRLPVGRTRYRALRELLGA